MPPEDDEPEDDEPEDGARSATIGDVERIVHDAVDGIKDLLKPAEGGTKSGATKRPTARDLEEELDELVTKKVGELKAREKAQGEDHDVDGKTEKAPPEGKPDEPRKRRVESVMGWL